MLKIWNNKIQLMIATKFKSSKYTRKKGITHSSRDKKELMFDKEKDNAIQKHFKSFQTGLEESMKWSDFVFDCVDSFINVIFDCVDSFINVIK